MAFKKGRCRWWIQNGSKTKKYIIFLLLREKRYILQSIVCSFKFFHVMNDALTEKNSHDKHKKASYTLQIKM